MVKAHILPLTHICVIGTFVHSIIGLIYASLVTKGLNQNSKESEQYHSMGSPMEEAVPRLKIDGDHSIVTYLQV